MTEPDPNRKVIRKVAIIGAGAAGLCAERHCIKEGFECDIFEQTGSIGGTWNYTDSVGLDENGLPIHSSMYKDLRTNLPKELMQYEDFPYPKMSRSYLYQPEVLNYIKSYAKRFGVEAKIKFFKHVTNVTPVDDNKWSLEVVDVKTKTNDQSTYDAVFVCNGHYSDPIIPKISGSEIFSGTSIHSHSYRTPIPYKEKKVLIIGAGPSGTDITKHIATVADKVFISSRSGAIFAPLPNQIVKKPPVARLKQDGVEFQDGSVERIDDVVFCTGYNFTFPFLSNSCNVEVTDNYVHPLYKQVINIEHPTMGFIGLPSQVTPFPLFDIQVRFFLSTLNGHFTLPSKEALLEDLKKEVEAKKDVPKRHFHKLGEKQGEYFDDLATTANIKKVPAVINKLYKRVRQNRNLDDCFDIVDDDNFIQTHWGARI